ncbi:MAG TPA: DUF1800 domain-containing protein [Bryobacteraceae bacterium]|nr:DUF1800 domain-containing protein [Bryobacteraceae bacterium]
MIFWLILSLTTASAVAPREMTSDQKVLHALNRLTFGARAADVEEVRRAGLQAWIDRQLHPESISENPVLEAKLAPLDTLRMSPRELVQEYPPPQVIKAMAEGRLPMPADPAKRATVQKLIQRYERKQGSTDDADPTAAIESLPLTVEQKTVLKSGSPEERLRLLESVPLEQQWALLDAMPSGTRQKLYANAPPELRRRIQISNGPFQVVSQDLTEGKLLRAAYSNRQLEEVLTDFWYNHFNVDLDKGADRFLVTSYERDVIRPHVLGRFKDLLLATAESPAMLFYLDNWQSTGPDAHPRPGQKQKAGLNENYGRELMELHTLGVDGGYTQRDVTEVARCFTGWTIREPRLGGGFEFNPRRHDNGEKHVLGVAIPAGGGMEDGLRVLDILARHPSTARFISRSLAVRFVSDNPPESLVKRMADAFTATDGDLREVMRAMINAPEFWDPANFRSKVKSPLEMTVSAMRAINADIGYTFAMNGVMTQLGEPLYRKLEPTGYSNRGTDWMNSASLLARMNFANSLARSSINGISVDLSQFSGDASQIERRLLLTEPSHDAQEAIQAGLAEQTSSLQGSLVAGLTLGSPDFQRR